MPAESTQAAALTFDAAVYRALSRRRSDTPYPHDGAIAAPAEAAQDAPGRPRPPDIPADAGHGSRKSSG